MKTFILKGLIERTAVVKDVIGVRAETLKDAARKLHGEFVPSIGVALLAPSEAFIFWDNFQPSSDTARVITSARRDEYRDPMSEGHVANPEWTRERVMEELGGYCCFALTELACVN